MRKLKIVVDSSANIMSLDGVDFACAPLRIITSEREFLDDENLDVAEMVEYLGRYKGKSKTSCPNITDWIDAFGDADDVFCITITSRLSGAYNAAFSAKQSYEKAHEGRRVFLIDSRSTGPEMHLLVDKLIEYVKEGLPFEEICERITAYQNQTGLYFMLKSVKNLVNNGRISVLVGKIIGFAGICIVAKASDVGEIQTMDKTRGEKPALAKILEHIKKEGLARGRAYIEHCQNLAGAERLRDMIKEQLGEIEVRISELRGLCSFYAEKGGILIGFEKM